MITRKRLTKAAGKRTSRLAILACAALGARKNKQCSACLAALPAFFRYGNVPEWGCPACNASPRERLVNYAIDTALVSVPTDGAVLHIAPGERSLIDRFKRGAARYLPADLNPEQYTVPGIAKIDLMEMELSKEFDLVYASHVMEHVPDDRIVLRNLRRAIRPGGEAWLIVPLHDGPTIDGSPEMAPERREKLFGQWDHLRQYGMDFSRRLERAGFRVAVINSGSLPEEDRRKFGLGDVLFIASVPKQ